MLVHAHLTLATLLKIGRIECARHQCRDVHELLNPYDGLVHRYVLYCETTLLCLSTDTEHVSTQKDIWAEVA